MPDDEHSMPRFLKLYPQTEAPGPIWAPTAMAVVLWLTLFYVQISSIMLARLNIRPSARCVASSPSRGSWKWWHRQNQDKTKQTGWWSSLKQSVLKHRLLYIGLLSALCVWGVSKSSCWQTLAVPVMVIVCQSLGGWGVPLSKELCMCVCVRSARGAWGRSCRVRLNSRVINPFNPTQRGCVCVFDGAACVFRCLVFEDGCH